MKFYFPPLNKLGNQAFRSLVLDNGADYVFTEMIRVEKLLEEDEVQLRKASIDNEQINQTVFQIIAEGDIELIIKAVEKLKELNPDIKEINYNMGCPQSSLCKNFNGGGILKNRDKLKQVSKILYQSCKKYNIIPSIKTRIGIDRESITIGDTLNIIKEIGIRKIYIHGRTLADNYVKQATYEEIKQVAKKYPEIEIILNGDVVGTNSYNQAYDKDLSGIAIGRAALEEPRIFNYLKEGIKFEFNPEGEQIKNRKNIILDYLQYAKQYNLNNSYTKSNLSYLTKNCVGAAKLRKEINQVNDIDEIINIIEKISTRSKTKSL